MIRFTPDLKQDCSTSLTHPPTFISLCHYAMKIFGKTNLVESNRCSLIPLCLIEPYLIFSIVLFPGRVTNNDDKAKYDIGTYFFLLKKEIYLSCVFIFYTL